MKDGWLTLVLFTNFVKKAFCDDSHTQETVCPSVDILKNRLLDLPLPLSL
jgi:hypothetical protein